MKSLKTPDPARLMLTLPAGEVFMLHILFAKAILTLPPVLISRRAAKKVGGRVINQDYLNAIILERAARRVMLLYFALTLDLRFKDDDMTLYLSGTEFKTILTLLWKEGKSEDCPIRRAWFSIWWSLSKAELKYKRKIGAEM